MLGYDPITSALIPLGLVLLNNKKYFAYKAALNMLYEYIFRKKNYLIIFNLLTMTCDFEKALIMAIRTCFTEIRIIGFLFHFAQAIQRHANSKF